MHVSPKESVLLAVGSLVSRQLYPSSVRSDKLPSSKARKNADHNVDACVNPQGPESACGRWLLQESQRTKVSQV